MQEIILVERLKKLTAIILISYAMSLKLIKTKKLKTL